VRILFMGSPDFALPTLRRLIESEHEAVGVVTQPDRPAGRRRELRPPPAKELAQARGLPVLQPERVNAPDSLAAINNLEPDAIVIAAYGQILKQPLLDIPRRGCLNVHASLLPKYRGASPVTAAILAGEEETGVTIIEVVLALDAGPIVTQRALPIEPSDTTGTLTEKLAGLGADLLIEVLPAWEQGALTPQPQDEAQASYAPQVRREDAVIDWSLPAVDVWRRVRAYNPWPVATTTVDGEPLRILEAWPLEAELPAPPGAMLPLPAGAQAPAGAGFAVRCGQGALAVVRAQRAGKRAISGEELLRGWRDLLGKRLPS
jgi:methionyl-tRNA formyltransferase